MAAKTRRQTRTAKLDRARSLVDKLERDELVTLRGELDLALALLDALENAPDEGLAGNVKVSPPDGQPGWIEHKYISRNGKQHGPYRYLRWRDGDGRKRSQYLGKVQ